MDADKRRYETQFLTSYLRASAFICG